MPAISWGVGGYHQIQLAPGQRGQWGKEKARSKIHLDFWPSVAELIDGRHQPLKAAVTFDGHMQASGLATGQALQIPFRLAQLRQNIVSQTQQAQSGAGETHGFALAGEQGQAETLLQILDLMGQGRLGQVQPFSGLHQAFSFAQGNQGAQMTYFQHASVLYMN